MPWTSATGWTFSAFEGTVRVGALGESIVSTWLPGVLKRSRVDGEVGLRPYHVQFDHPRCHLAVPRRLDEHRPARRTSPSVRPRSGRQRRATATAPSGRSRRPIRRASFRVSSTPFPALGAAGGLSRSGSEKDRSYGHTGQVRCGRPALVRPVTYWIPLRITAPNRRGKVPTWPGAPRPNATALPTGELGAWGRTQRAPGCPGRSFRGITSLDPRAPMIP